MTFAALFLAAALCSQEEKPPAPPDREQVRDIPIDPWEDDEGFGLNIGLRGGGCRLGPFDALTLSGRRKVEQTLLFDAGIDLRGEYEFLTLTLAGDYAVASGLRMTVGAVLAGVKIPLSDSLSPLELHLAIGPCFGTLDATLADFGGFKTGVGFEGRIRTLAWIHENVGVEFWLDLRQLQFKYDEPVISGDTHTRPGMVAFGAGLVMRF